MDVGKLYFNSLLLIYGFVLIVCDNVSYIKYIHAINLLIWISFLVNLIFSKDKIVSFNTFFRIYIAFVIVTLFSAFLSEDFFYAARRSFNQVLIFINIFVIYNIHKKYNNFMYLIYGIFLALTINFLWLIGIVDLNLTYAGWRFQGTVLQANKFVFILMFGMMMAIYLLSLDEIKESVKMLLYLLFTVFLYMVFFTASKAGLGSSALLILLLIFVSMNYRNIAVLFFVILGGYLIVSYTSLIDIILEKSTLDLEYTWINLLERIDSFSSGIESGAAGTETSTSARLRMVYDALTMWGNSPVFGNGIAAFEIKYGHYSHNNIVELLVSFGIVGFMLYYLLYFYMYLRIQKIKNIKSKIMFSVFLMLFLVFDQSTVSYTGKFKILAIFIVYLSIEDFKRRYERVKN